MATSKTLTPTNVTIQIPEFTDRPDQRVTNDCIDKEADAINALNSKITTLNTSTVKRFLINGYKKLLISGRDIWFLAISTIWYEANQSLTFGIRTSNGAVMKYVAAGNDVFTITNTTDGCYLEFTPSYPGGMGITIIDITGAITGVSGAT